MRNTIKINSIKLINADSLQYIAALPDNSIDLIVTDPPYPRVKPNGWGNQWRGGDGYLHWLSDCPAEYTHVLKPASSIYLFYGHRLTSDIGTMMHVQFNVLNHIIWTEPSGRWNGCNEESLRACLPSTERILFAEHYLGPRIDKENVYERKGTELKQYIMTSLIGYSRSARESLGVSSKGIVEATRKRNVTSHWFGASRWQPPNEVDYRKLQELFTRVTIDKHIQQKLEHPHHQLVAAYQSLNHKYSELLGKYRTLQRCFSVFTPVPYTGVWIHKLVQLYPGKHPCEKPVDMLKQTISASSRPGDTIADLFMDSGSTVKAAIELSRRAIGVELEADRFAQTTEEVEKLSKT